MKSRMILLLGMMTSSLVSAQVSLGTYTQFMGQHQNSTDGGTNSFDFNPLLGLFYPVTVGGVTLKPELGLILYSVESDDEYSKRGYYWIIDAIYPLSQAFELRGGISTFTTRISGDGGPKTQNNGSSTSEFYLPSESESSSIFALNLGIDFILNGLDNYSIRFETFLNRPFDESRAFSYILSVNALYF